MIVRVADSEPGEHGDLQLSKDLIQNFAEGKRRLKRWLEFPRPAIGAFAEDDGRRGIEFAREPKMGQHAVDAVWLLVDIFDEEDLAACVDLVRRAQCSGDEREIAANDWRARFPSANGA